jgi:hypothetical protein
MPANRITLYKGILRERVYRMESGHWFSLNEDWNRGNHMKPYYISCSVFALFFVFVWVVLIFSFVVRVLTHVQLLCCVAVEICWPFEIEFFFNQIFWYISHTCMIN